MEKLRRSLCLIVFVCLVAALGHEPGLPEVQATFEAPTVVVQQPAPTPTIVVEQPAPTPTVVQQAPKPVEQPAMPAIPEMHAMMPMPSHPIENPILCPALVVTHDVSAVSSPLEDQTILHKVKFETATPNEGIEWIDVHFQINGGTMLNFRMQKISNNLFEFSPIALKAGDRLTYKFTYCVMFSNGQTIDCDTEMFEFLVPTAVTEKPQELLMCQDIEYTQNISPTGTSMDGAFLYKFNWASKTPITMSGFLDLHYRLSPNSDWINVRMSKLSETEWEYAGVLARPGETIEYWFTFCILLENNQRIDCDTKVETFTVPSMGSSQNQPILSESQLRYLGLNPEQIQQQLAMQQEAVRSTQGREEDSERQHWLISHGEEQQEQQQRGAPAQEQAQEQENLAVQEQQPQQGEENQEEPASLEQQEEAENGVADMPGYARFAASAVNQGRAYSRSAYPANYYGVEHEEL